jgi:hypothetical protein
LAVGVLYLWLVAFPLSNGQTWSWWTIALTGALGFLSFLAYLGYGYFDSWHGMGTLALLPVFIGGLALTYRTLPRSRITQEGDGNAVNDSHRRQPGAILLLATAAGMVAGGATILAVGMTSVFVVDDLAFIGATEHELQMLNPALIPLIAHDRAGFGGGLLTTGLLVGACVWYSPITRSLRQALWLAGVAGFGCAIGIHLVVGYTSPRHLAPAAAGAVMFVAGMVLSARATHGTS